MTTNGFTINGVVSDTTNISGVDRKNQYLIAAKDIDNVFYVPLLDSTGIKAWGSFNSNYNSAGRTYLTFGAYAPNLQTSTIEAFLFGGMNTNSVNIVGSELKGYGGVSGSGSSVFGGVVTPEPIDINPTVNVEKDRILLGVWYKFLRKGTQTEYLGSCYPTNAPSGKWRGVGNGSPVLKTLLFTFIPMNNYIVTPDSTPVSVLSLSAFYTWRYWSDTSNMPKCLGQNPGNNCVFALNRLNEPGSTSSASSPFGYSFTSSGNCSGTTYANCSKGGKCLPVGDSMVCSFNSSNVESENVGKSSHVTYYIYVILGVVVLLVLLFALRKK